MLVDGTPATAEGTETVARITTALSNLTIGPPVGPAEPQEVAPPPARQPASTVAARPLVTALAAAAAAVQQLPGSPITLAHLRAGLPLPPLPDPAASTEEQWQAQGHEVRGIIGHRIIDGQLYLRVVWEDSWQPGADLAHLDELRLYRQRLQQAGDSTDVCSLAAAQLQAAEAEAEAEEAQQRRQPGGPRREPAPPRP
ncbi:hypothetical protein ABPG77_009577 [Micractinium sp. CCAP 211/92]